MWQIILFGALAVAAVLGGWCVFELVVWGFAEVGRALRGDDQDDATVPEKSETPD